MKEIRWDHDKNTELKSIRNISFEQLLNARFIGIERHRSKEHQRLMLFEYQKYVWVVPYV
jgi:hypothetical protein